MKNLIWARRHVFVLAGTGFSLLTASCNSGDLPDLQGRYIGEQESASGKIQVVAQVPGFIEVDKARVLRFKVYPTLGSAGAAEYRVALEGDKVIRLRAPELRDNEAQLAISGSCAVSKSASQDVTLCWSTGNVRLAIQRPGEGAFHLSLRRSNDLPPIENRVGAGATYTIDELVGRARFLNYSVAQEAERVYQARENIKAARGNLLPKLSLRAIAGVFTQDYLSVVSAVVPFLFPGNWYRWLEAKPMFKAERNSFASLRGNEMNAVEGLYYLLYRDQAVLEELKRHIGWMKKTEENLRKEEEAGALPTGSADYFGATVGALDRDRVVLENLIQIEFTELSQGVGLPPLNGVTGLAQLEIPDLSQVQAVYPADFFRDAQLKSFEIKTLSALIEASRYATAESIFSFLDPEGNGYLSFGTPSTFRIGKSRERELEKRKNETYALIEKRSANVATEHNGALESFAIANASLAKTRRRLEWLMKRHLTGDSTLDEMDFINQLVELELKLMELNTDRVTSMQSWMLARARQQRLLLSGFYQDLEGGLPDGPEKLKYRKGKHGAPLQQEL